MEQSLLYLILLYNVAFSYTPIYEKDLPEEKRTTTERMYLFYGLPVLDEYGYKYSENFKAEAIEDGCEEDGINNEVYWSLPFFRSLQYSDITSNINIRLLMEDAIDDMEYWLHREFDDEQIKEQKQYCLQKYNELLESIVAIDMTQKVNCALYNSDYKEIQLLKWWNRRKLYKQTKQRYDTMFKEIASKQMTNQIITCDEDEELLSKTIASYCCCE